MAPVFFCSLASEEEHDDEDDDDKDDDSDEEEEGGRGVGSEGCSPWGPIDDVGGRGTSARGGPSMSPGRESGNSTDGFQLFITAASHRFSNLSERHCSELFQSPAPPAPPKQFWYTCSGNDALKAGCLAAEWFDVGFGGRGLLCVRGGLGG